MTLLPFLDLDSGPGELGRVALASLGAQLGDDAAIRRVSEDGSVSATDIVIEHRDGIAFLGLRALDPRMGDRFLAVLDGWMRGSPPTRAIILDVARCELGEPTSAAVVVNAFAPGRTAFGLSFRNPDSGALEQRSWHGGADSGAMVDPATPVFVLTSSHTGSVAEAVAHALRYYRTARIFGATTPGSGRVMNWFRLPWRAWFGFTVADLIGADGQSLKDRPVIPDACLGDQGMVPLSERTPEAYRAACPGAEREVPSALAIDYVRSLLASETPPGKAPPLQRGDQHG
jgi:C-terminal processing protease CtpA/Prc